MSEVDRTVEEMFRENLYSLYHYGRKMMALCQGDTGDHSLPLPPEDPEDLPIDVLMDWIDVVSPVGKSLTGLTMGVAEVLQARTEPGGL